MMQRRVTVLYGLALVLFLVGSVIASSVVPGVLAQQDATPQASPPPAATPVAAPPMTPVPVVLPTAAELALVFPPGIDITPLAVGAIDQLPADATVLRLERVTVPAGEDLATRTPTAPEVLFGELGAATIVDAFGLTAPLTAGRQATLTEGSSSTLRNTSTAPATLLRLSLGSPSSPDAATQVLLESQLPTVPGTPASLVLALSTWQPGADTGSFTAAGPIGMFVNSGTLTVTSPSGLEASLGAGQGLVFPAGVPQRERNAGADPVQALVIAVAPMGQPMVAAVPTPTPIPTATPEPTATALPTSTPEPTATPMPTATPLPTATPEPTATPMPTATPTPTPPPEPVIYEAGPNGGLEAWGSLAGWTVLDGELISDGSNCTTIVAPVDLSGYRDYAVEAEIQVITEGNSDYGFGIFARWNGGERYWGGFNRGFSDQFFIALRSDVPDYNTYDRIGTQDGAPGGDWHTYRLAVEKNQSRLYVDGSEVTRATDNRLLSTGDAGIWCRGPVQLAVRSFKVIPLGESALAETPAQREQLAGNTPDMQGAQTVIKGTFHVAANLPASGANPSSLAEVSDAFENPGQAEQLFTK